ncbi:MAG: hypothetical protein ACOCWG_05035 [bacterium]
MIRLFTTYFPISDPIRKKEIETALQLNFQLSALDEIHILNEGGFIEQFDNPKIHIVEIKGRPTYTRFFKAINKITSENDINIIANTDISFDKNIALLKKLNWEHKSMALSRWEYNSDGSTFLYNHNDSQDTWIFKGKIKNVNADFPLGVPRCDNRFMYELQKGGYQVINPAFSIKTYHHHAGIRKKYNTENLPHFVEPPYAYLYPHNLFGFCRTILFNITHSHKFAPYRYDIKKINSWIIVRLIRKLAKAFYNKDLPLIGYK